ncbi:MAG: aspartyl/asparaginyl beta-hydroxylase domain-containing protein [Acetobacteraceae bacterium]
MEVKTMEGAQIRPARRRSPALKRLRRFAVVLVILIPGAWFVPVLTGILVACGAADVLRHRRITLRLVEQYFTGNGILTWLLSPFNLLADLLSHRNRGVFHLADLPAAHRAEIEACTRALIQHADEVKAHVARTLAANRRGMFTFQWYGEPQSPALRIPAFEQKYRYIKTIALSVFNTRERTHWHFGPLRLTFRVLFNLDPIASREVFIEVDNRTHYWMDEPLFIFDDTFFHRSINDVDHVRYCLFMDILRPNRCDALFNAAVRAVRIISGSFQRMFYKNWKFLR